VTQQPDAHASGVQAVVFDFYGTLGRATKWVSVDAVLSDHGIDLSEETRNVWWNQGIDGIDHAEHSGSRDDYVAWQRRRLLAMLAETDLHPGEYDVVVEKLQEGSAQRVLETYPETHEVLAALRARGVRLAVCSNWDWDLHEALGEVGLGDSFDVVVSSAWAGARKPHPRIFADTLEKLGTSAESVVFVGDTWGPDVVGPRSFGMRAVYLQRDGHWPDPTAPSDLTAQDVTLAPDLRTLVELVSTP
jgi:putative hydrolase of the HAD superfamily